MEIHDVITIRAPVPRVWNALSDIGLVTSCLPEIEEVKPTDENKYRAVLRAKVSYISAIFDILVTIVGRQEPEHMEVLMEGKARRGMGVLKARNTLDLRALSEGETALTYNFQVSVSGVLATLGLKVIGQKVVERAQSFAKEFTVRCEAQES